MFWFLSSFYNCCTFFFGKGDPLQIKVNKLSSTKTQLPYDYYFLKYCKPQKIKNSAENLGEVLRGDRIENSIYTVSIALLPFTSANKPKKFLICPLHFNLCLKVSYEGGATMQGGM